jgi:thioredoxin reductase/NAD-dependent dihydropyrimidine dehydrogenase PreA subunit
MEQGFNVIEHIASLPDARGGNPDVYDVLVVGAGASGLNAALEAKQRGLSCLVLEKEEVANTIENFPEGKWVYAEPDKVPPKGKLWLDGATKEDLVSRWHQIVHDNKLDVRTETPLTGLTRYGDGFEAAAGDQTFKAKRVILAIGQRGNPRKLGVTGEQREEVYHRLYSPRHYKNEDILVVGGGNSAVEAAVVLSEANRVVLSYRRAEFSRIFKDNERKLNDAVAAGRIRLLLRSEVQEFQDGRVILNVGRDGKVERQTLPYQHAFVLIGAELPVKFLKSLGVELENEWKGSLLRSAALVLATLFGTWLVQGWAAESLPSQASNLALVALLAGAGILTAIAMARRDRYAWLGLSFLVWYTIYGAKVGSGSEFWPFKGWAYDALSFLDRPWSFWYTVLYTALLTIFGFQAMKRWGFDRKDKFQIWRFVSLIGFQWIFFFVIPEFLFQWAVKYQWLGELSQNPQFADQAWRSYGIILAWPLFFYTFFYDPHWIWIAWGVFLTFGLIPFFVLFHGKRYCSWVCGCGGLAETFGDRWRHLAPKGKSSIQWERMNLWILVLAVVVTAGMLLKDTYGFLAAPTRTGMDFYRIIVDIWLVGILPVTLYPFLGGKVWCRYWCPLAKMMGLTSSWFGKFKIRSNDKCISCGECSRYCQVGIDVMNFALKQEDLDNKNSSCIGCGVCVTVCPMDVLSFGEGPQPALVQIEPSIVADRRPT